MKKLLLSVSVIISCAASAQNAFWTETFGQGCNRGQNAGGFSDANGTWTETSTGTNDSHADKWFISATASGSGAQNCSDNCIMNSTQNRSLHIGNATVSIPNLIYIGEDTGSTYLTGVFCQANICSTTNKRIESPTINTVNRTSIGISFLYYEGGEFMGDEATLWYSPDNGVTWQQVDQLAKISASCNAPSGLWTEFSLLLPASANNNPGIKFAFNWTNNNNSQGTDPSFAVDDIAILENFPLAIAPTASIGISLVTEGNTVIVNGSANWELVSVTDVTGREIATAISGNQIVFTEPSGMYFITMLVEGEKTVHKVMFTR